MDDVQKEATPVNLQVKLTGKYAEAFALFKDRPEVGESRKNTVAMQEIVRTLPEWIVVNRT